MTTINYQNGNANITIENNGTRTIGFEGILNLEYPLNIDIRVSNKCAFGQRPDGSWVLCNFCHESAQVEGKECDYVLLQNKLRGLPQGIELAIGANEITDNLLDFLQWAYLQGYICNVTVNQGHLKRDLIKIQKGINAGWIKGLGVSYRGMNFTIPNYILDYENTVFHVIIGIDSILDIQALSGIGVKKILCLGEKDFGANVGNVNLDSIKHKQWRWWIGNLFNEFEVVSFDNLGVEQLKLNRFFTQDSWNTFYQGEHSFYINAVNERFAPSSRSADSVPWDMSVKDYFLR